VANLSVTRRCDRTCAFCFAAAERATGPLDMSADVFEAALDFLERSGVPDARLLGGEPMLHPAFAEFADRALERGFALTVMTGGLVPGAAVAHLAALPAERVKVFLNATPEDSADAALDVGQRLLCETLGDRVELGMTLVTPGDDPMFMLEWVARYRLAPRVRIGVAHPVLGGHNTSANAGELAAIGATIEGFVAAAEAAGVTVGFDCGLTPCMFSGGFAAAHPDVIETVGTHCGPIVDILPEGDAIACYALKDVVRIPLGETATRQGLIATLEEHLDRLVPAAGTYEMCAACAHHAAGRCNGGCRARQGLRARASAAPRGEG
jgi:MoaA/NifB/PqqE/SkfB family radical SAM enzyme